MNKIKISFLAIFILFFISTFDSKSQSIDTNKEFYVVLSINNATPIKYKNKIISRGDTILLNEKLEVGKDQIVILKNTYDQTKKYIKGKDYTKWKCKTLWDYLFPHKKRITRDNEPENHLRKIIGDELLWVDSLRINTIYNPNDQRYFVIEVVGDSSNIGRFLPSDIPNNIKFVLTKESLWGNEEPKELYFNLRIGYGRWYDYKDESNIIVKNVKLIPFEK